MLGKRRKLENSDVPQLTPEQEEEERRKRKRDRKLAKEVDKHNSAARSKTLVDLHTSKVASKGPEEDDGKAPVIWDRDLHLGSSRFMDDSKRKQFIADAKGVNGLGSRFGSSGFA